MDAEAAPFSTDNALGAFLAFLADEQVSARTARLYLAYIGRFGHWLREQYRADLLEATSHDLRAYRTQLTQRHKPAAVNAALAALRRFYRWATATRRMKTDPTAKLKPVPSQLLAPKGFDSVEPGAPPARRRARRPDDECRGDHPLQHGAAGGRADSAHLGRRRAP
jgi:site-specific recombinase XerC